MALEYDRVSAILDNAQVDDIVDAQGQIDQTAALDFDMPDRDIIRNLNFVINDSEAYWNDAKGFDLKNSRNENERWYLGKVDESGLYKHQKQYKENQVFVGEQSIIAYVTGQIAGPLVVPAGKENIHKLFAADLEKAIKSYCEDVINLDQLVELWVQDLDVQKIAIAHFYYDADLEEVILERRNPATCILDKDAPLGKNPRFHCDVIKMSASQMLAQWPDKEEALLKELGIQRKTVKQMEKMYAVRRVWVTHYKDGKAEEGVVWYFNDFVIEKMRNPNYLYARKDLNLLKYPKKPYIYGNHVNMGNHLIDSTSPLEQAAMMQEYLMRRGRQIAENADKANGVIVISTKSGLTKDDGQNYTGDPAQKLFVDDDDGMGVERLVTQLQAMALPDYVLQDKQDARMQIGNIMGAPTDFTGSQADDGDPTLGEVMVKKNQAAGRQDLKVRVITRMLSDIYEYLVQMFIVWYTEPRKFVHDAGDGEYDFITIKRDLIHKGIRVKASKPANPDRSRMEAIVLNLLKNKAISLLDAFKILQFDNAQQLYDNWAKQMADPQSLARDALDVIDESEAYVAFVAIMNGDDVKPPANPSKEYVLSLRKLMIYGTFTNEKGESVGFLDAKNGQQNKFVKYVNKCIDMLEQRMQMDELSQVAEQNPQALAPNVPLPPLGMQGPSGPPTPGQVMGGQPPMPPAPMGPGGPMPPQGMPPAPGPIGPPPAGPPMGGAPTPSSVFAGTPIPQPGQAPVPNPGNPGSLPMV